MNNKLTKNSIFLLIALQFLLTKTYAENYPYRSDFLWVTNPNHSDWLYSTGENAIIDIQLYKYGIAIDATDISYTISPDMLEPTSEGTTKIKKGKATINIGTRKTPGFIDLSLKTTINGVQTKHHVKVGFSVDKIKPFTQEPTDFSLFWDETIKAYQTPIEVSRELATEYCTDLVECWLVKLKTDREHFIYGYLTMPRDRSGKKLPAVMCPPGAGIKTIKEPLRHKYYAENGFIRFEIEIHGLNPTLSNETFKEISTAFSAKDNGYLVNSIADRNRYYMRHVYGGMVAAMKYLETLPEWDGKNLAVQGGSQGGALALITAALCKDVTLCVANHPALTDMAAYSEKGRTGGYPHFKKDVLTKTNIENLAYFDVINFCRHISCPVRLTWGYNDNTCPPTTSYAAWNTLTCPKESFITPINEHWTSETMEYEHMKWIKSKLK